MNPLLPITLQFIACVAAIGAAGYQLARNADLIAEHTGLSRSWIGLALLATATSLPELATGISSVTVAQAPNIAVGDALGSCVINLAFLVVVDLLHRSAPVYTRTGQGHVLAAAFGVVLLGFIGASILVSAPVAAPAAARFGVGLSTPVVLGLYVLAMRAVFTYEKGRASVAVAVPSAASGTDSLRQAVGRFCAAAVIVVAAGIALPVVAVDLAAHMGWSYSFVGTLFVAFATSVPELAVTLSALRMGALDLAVGNLLGSNLFNAAIVAVDDLFYRPGPLLAHVSPVHATTAASAVVMTGLVMVGLVYRPSGRVLRSVSAVSLGLLAVYLLNAYTLYLHVD